MKLKEMQLSPKTMMAMANALLYRTKNLADMTKRGQLTSESIISDLCVMEAKFDAVLMILEDGGFDFSQLDSYMQKAFHMQVSTLESFREQAGLPPIFPTGPKGEV